MKMEATTRYFLLGTVALGPLLFVNVAAAGYVDYVLGLGPEAYWRLNGNTPGALEDETDNHDASGSSGSITFNQAAQTLAGDAGNTAIRVNNGGTDHVTVPHHADLVIGSGESVSIAAWINPNSLGNHDTILAKGRTSNNNNTANYTLRLSSGQLVFYYRNSANTGWGLYQTNSSVAQIGRWDHVAVVHTFGNGANTELYVNGSEITAAVWAAGTGDEDPYSTSGEQLWIGSNFPGEAWDGLLDEVALFDRRLTGTEVANLADVSIPEPSTLTLAALGLLGLLAWGQRRRG